MDGDSFVVCKIECKNRGLKRINNLLTKVTLFERIALHLGPLGRILTVISGIQGLNFCTLARSTSID